jgi:hypothetical protein
MMLLTSVIERCLMRELHQHCFGGLQGSCGAVANKLHSCIMLCHAAITSASIGGCPRSYVQLMLAAVQWLRHREFPCVYVHVLH